MNEVQSTASLGVGKVEEKQKVGMCGCSIALAIGEILLKMRDATLKLTRSEEKQLAVVEAAEKLFLEHGFGSTSMDDIAREAGVSKRTVYAHFTSKEILFTAVMQLFCAKIGARPFMESDLEAMAPREALIKTGVQFLSLILHPQAQSLYRNVIAETPTFPSLGEAFFDGGPHFFLGRVEALLTDYDRRGLLRVDQPGKAGEVFFGALKGGPVARAMMLGKEHTEQEIEAFVTLTVDLLLPGLGWTADTE